MYLTQSLQRALQLSPQGTATVCDNREQTWSEFGQRVFKLSGWLVDQGLKPDDRVAILSLNSDRFLECIYATGWAGGIYVPLNTRLNVSELAVLLNDVGAEFLFVDSTFKEAMLAIRDQMETVRHIISLDDDGDAEVHGYQAAIEAGAAIDFVDRSLNDTSAIYYTGGTTGVPKGVMLNHDSLTFYSNSLTMCGFYDNSSVYIHVAPMFHLGDHGVLLVTMAGGTHVFVSQLDAEKTLRLIAKHRVTHCMVVPTIIQMLTDVAQKMPELDLSALKIIGYAASPMPVAMAQLAQKVFPNATFTTGYGLTEAPGLANMSPQDMDFKNPKNKLKSVGRPYPGMDVRIVDDQGKMLPVGSSGEIIARGPIVMKGYWKRPEATQETLRGEWLHTGDIGYFDEEGFLFICDRAKDMIITGGENVYSIEVESMLYQHPAVSQCAVIAIPSKKWGEAIHAVVCLHDGETVSEQILIEFCREQLAHYKCPKSVEIGRNPLPLTGAAKVNKKLLREPYWQVLETNVT